MGKIGFVTDSTCGIHPELRKKYNIKVAPYSINFEEESVRDNEKEMSPAEFEEKCKATGIMPKTAVPSSGIITGLYDELKAQGCDTVMSIHTGSEVSGIVGAAEIAAKDTDLDVAIVDSHIVGMPLGFMVLEGVKAAERGMSKDEIVSLVNKVRANTNMYITTVEVAHIESSGRIRGAEEAAESAIKVKPIIAFEGGIPKVQETPRTTKAALARMIEMVQERSGGKKIIAAAVTHANREKEAVKFAEQVKEAFGLDDVHLYELGLTLTVHLGNGALSVIPLYDYES